MLLVAQVVFRVVFQFMYCKLNVTLWIFQQGSPLDCGARRVTPHLPTPNHIYMQTSRCSIAIWVCVDLQEDLQLWGSEPSSLPSSRPALAFFFQIVQMLMCLLALNHPSVYFSACVCSLQSRPKGERPHALALTNVEKMRAHSGLNWITVPRLLQWWSLFIQLAQMRKCWMAGGGRSLSSSKEAFWLQLRPFMLKYFLVNNREIYWSSGGAQLAQ